MGGNVYDVDTMIHGVGFNIIKHNNPECKKIQTTFNLSFLISSMNIKILLISKAVLFKNPKVV